MIASGLPNAQLATIPAEKVTAYLLASNHPSGRAKSLFFRSFGFTATTWHLLHNALLDHARSAPMTATRDTVFGTKYILEGPLLAPDGRSPSVRAVRFIETGNIAPRFVPPTRYRE